MILKNDTNPYIDKGERNNDDIVVPIKDSLHRNPLK